MDEADEADEAGMFNSWVSGGLSESHFHSKSDEDIWELKHVFIPHDFSSPPPVLISLDQY